MCCADNQGTVARLERVGLSNNGPQTIGTAFSCGWPYGNEVLALARRKGGALYAGTGCEARMWGLAQPSGGWLRKKKKGEKGIHPGRLLLLARGPQSAKPVPKRDAQCERRRRPGLGHTYHQRPRIRTSLSIIYQRLSAAIAYMYIRDLRQSLTSYGAERMTWHDNR